MLSVNECLARIAKLPQAAHIREEDARRWVRLTMGIEPERIGWHIGRAGGIGGSEAGALLAWRFGGFNARTTPEKLGKAKLLLLPPERRNDDTGRGAFLEDHICAVYERGLDRDGRRWKLRDDIKARIEAAPHRDYPWLRASIDRVYEIDGKIVIMDSKAPSEDSLQEFIRTGHMDEYVAQLNHYALVARGRGVRVDALELAFYDYRRVSRVGCHVVAVPIDRGLQNRIVEATGCFWNDFVMGGVYPEDEKEPLLRADDGVPREVEAAARRAVVRKIIGDKALKDYADDQRVVAEWVRRSGRLSNGVLPLGRFAEGVDGFLQVRASEELDVEEALNRLRDLGATEAEIEGLRGPDKYDTKKVSLAYDALRGAVAGLVSALRTGGDAAEHLDIVDKLLSKAPVKEKGDFTKEKIFEALESCGEVPYTFLTERISSGLPRGRHQDLEERKAAVGGHLDELIGGLAPEGPDALPEGPAPRR
jgi:predicted phage-related endonuclease